MINYVIASVLSIALGQFANHLIRRLPEIIEEDDAIKKLIPTLKSNFKVDIKYSLILLIISNLLTYATSGIATYIYICTIAMLLVVFVIDYKIQLIPDTVQVLLGLIGITNLLLNLTNYLDYILGALVGGAIFLTLALLAKIIYKKEGMGFGDVKLMAALGLIFGVKKTLAIAVISFFVAAIISIILIALKKKRIDSYIPFGPFIVIGTLAVMLLGPQVYIDVYYNFCSWLGTGMTDLIFKLIK